MQLGIIWWLVWLLHWFKNSGIVLLISAGHHDYLDILGLAFNLEIKNPQVLTNGIEVKLQRNALSVIEAPTGNEDDDDLEFENLQWNGSDMGEFRIFSILIHWTEEQHWTVDSLNGLDRLIR